MFAAGFASATIIYFVMPRPAPELRSAMLDGKDLMSGCLVSAPCEIVAGEVALQLELSARGDARVYVIDQSGNEHNQGEITDGTSTRFSFAIAAGDYMIAVRTRRSSRTGVGADESERLRRYITVRQP
jgi:hypothetical protein